MDLTDSEKNELEWLIRKFGSCTSFFIDTNSVFETAFHPELVYEDEKNEYLGKIDDSAPGIRYQKLGSVQEYDRYLELKEKAKL